MRKVLVALAAIALCGCESRQDQIKEQQQAALVARVQLVRVCGKSGVRVYRDPVSGRLLTLSWQEPDYFAADVQPSEACA
jgi:hypothetical protein